MATKPMTKAQLVAALADESGMDKKGASGALDSLINIITREVSGGGAVTLPGVGKIYCRERPERMVRNPATGEQIKKDADKVVKMTIERVAQTGGPFALRRNMDIKAIVMGLAFALMWSSAFTSARVIVEYAPPLTALALRFFISGAIGVSIALALGQSFQLTRKQWLGVVIFGFCQNALYLGLNFIAMQTIDASLAAIIASTMPLLVALAGWLVFGDKIKPLGITGLIAGVVGVSLIMGARLQGNVDLFGIVLCVIAVISLTIATLAVLGASSGGNVLMIVGLQMLVGAAILTGPALVFETFDVTWTWQLIVAFTYTTIVPGLLATLIWFLLVGRIGAVRASTFHFLNPFFGVAVAAVLLGERLGVLDVVGVVVIAGGILAVQLSKRA